MKSDPLNRFDRIVAMLVHLQLGRVVKAQEIADRFQVNLRTDYRQFRTDRIQVIRRTSVPFTKQHGDTASYKNTDVPVERTKVVIRVDKVVAKYIKTGSNYYGFVSKKTIGNKVEMVLQSSSARDGFPRWFMMFGDCAEIVEPESLKERVSELLVKASANLKMGG